MDCTSSVESWTPITNVWSAPRFTSTLSATDTPHSPPPLPLPLPLPLPAAAGGPPPGAVGAEGMISRAMLATLSSALIQTTTPVWGAATEGLASIDTSRRAPTTITPHPGPRNTCTFFACGTRHGTAGGHGGRGVSG